MSRLGERRLAFKAGQQKAPSIHEPASSFQISLEWLKFEVGSFRYGMARPKLPPKAPFLSFYHCDEEDPYPTASGFASQSPGGAHLRDFLCHITWLLWDAIGVSSASWCQRTSRNTSRNMILKLTR